MRRFLMVALAAFSLIVADSARGQAGLESIKRSKQATGMVQVNAGSGSAFCVDAGGLFLTSAHVVDSVAVGSKVRLLLQGGEVGQKMVDATVLRADKDRDLALLRVSGVGGLVALELGKDDDLIETTEVTVFGYPLRGQFQPNRRGQPSIMVNTGRISSLPRVDGKLDKIVLDVTLNPGNSGGPIIDKSGKVVGVVQGGLRGPTVTGINFAVPVSLASEFIASPTVEFEPPAVAFKDRFAPSDWTVSIISVGPIEPAPTVEISLGAPEGSPRLFPAKPVGPGRYSASVIPVQPPARVEARTIELTADFEAGQIRGRLKDRDVKVGAEPIRLGDLAVIARVPKPEATGLDGRVLSGAVSGLSDATIALGELEIALDLGKAARIAIRPPQSEPDTIPCVAVVRSGAKELARIERSLKLQGAPSGVAGAPAPEFRPAAFSGKRVVRKIPGRASDVVPGGNGRYLFLTLRELKKLAVFDLASCEVDRYLPLAGDHALVAAGAERLIIVYPNTKIIQAYKIGSFERTDSKSIPGDGLIRSIAMGASSQGPLLFAKTYANAGVVASSTGTIGFIDPDTLRPIPDYRVEGRNQVMRQDLPKGEMAFQELNMDWNAVLRAAAGGTTFGAWRTAVSPTGVISVVVQGKAVRYAYQHNSAGHVVPGPDGRILYTGVGGLLDENLKPVQAGLPSEDYYLPSTDPGYFLGFTNLPDAFGRNIQNQNQNQNQNQSEFERKPRCKVFLTGATTPLLDFGEVEEMNFQRRANTQDKSAPPLDRRIVFNPSAKVLVTVPESADQLVVRRVDIIESLQQSPVDYLFVTSLPPRTAFRRQAYEYQVAVASRKGGATYSLTDGPAGMTISPQGKVSWNVPANFEEDEAAIVVLVNDASGQETFHSFTLRVK
jgi:S1-C subfamily serine protease